jgi:hypothetical protein
MLLLPTAAQNELYGMHAYGPPLQSPLASPLLMNQALNVEQQPPHSGGDTHAHPVELTQGECSKQGLYYRAIRASLYTSRMVAI